MKVGVYLLGFPPDVGGGHVFEDEILGGLTKHAHESRHQFSIFVQEKTNISRGIPFQTERLGVMGLGEPTEINGSNTQSRMRKRLDRILARLGLSAHKSGSDMNRDELFRMSARKAGIDFLWNPTMHAISTDLPYIATIWDIQHRLQPWFPEVSSEGEWESREKYFSKHIRRATYIITGNQAGKEELSFFYQIPEDRFRILPHPAPEEKQISPEQLNSILAKYSLSPGYLYYPAQFWAHKNHANLLFALQLLKDQHAMKLELVLVGSDRGNAQYVRNLADQLGLKEQVHFLGFVPRTDLLALYKGALALTYVSFFGPENLPPLEAFSMGCPVVASSVHGAEEQLGNAALFVDPTNAHQIADHVHDLSQNETLRDRLIGLGYERARKWSSSEFVRGIFEILDEFEYVRRCWPSG